MFSQLKKIVNSQLTVAILPNSQLSNVDPQFRELGTKIDNSFDRTIAYCDDIEAFFENFILIG